MQHLRFSCYSDLQNTSHSIGKKHIKQKHNSKRHSPSKHIVVAVRTRRKNTIVITINSQGDAVSPEIAFLRDFLVIPIKFDPYVLTAP